MCHSKGSRFLCISNPEFAKILLHYCLGCIIVSNLEKIVCMVILKARESNVLRRPTWDYGVVTSKGVT